MIITVRVTEGTGSAGWEIHFPRDQQAEAEQYVAAIRERGFDATMSVWRRKA